MNKNYAVIGAGRQGIAAAYDLIKFGNAGKIAFVDNDFDALNLAREKLFKLTGFDKFNLHFTEVTDKEKLIEILKEHNSAISAVPYYFNELLTECAIAANCNFIDLGGNTSMVWKQLEFNDKAKASNVSIIPDCGMDPGLNISMIEYALSKFERVEEIKNYGGGLPLDPKPPWNYELFFNINGLTNEYYGDSIFIRDGKITGVPCFSELEIIELDDKLGRLEANVTNGGLSILPWKLENKIERLENRTLRYPGHWEWFNAYSKLGLFEEEPIDFKGIKISPRKFYHFLLEPKLKTENPKDVGIVMITATGIKDGYKQKMTLSVIQKFDEKTGFTAMQKLTGWHASVMAILAAHNVIKPGALSVDEAATGKVIMNELTKRGFEFVEKWEEI